MSGLCDKTEAKAFHPPEPKQGDGAILWAVVVVISVVGAALWAASGRFPWY